MPGRIILPGTKKKSLTNESSLPHTPSLNSTNGCPAGLALAALGVKKTSLRLFRAITADWGRGSLRGSSARKPRKLKPARQLKPRGVTKAAGKWRVTHEMAVQAQISHETADKAWDAIWDAIKAWIVSGGDGATVQLFPYRAKLGKSGIGRFTRKRNPLTGVGYVAWKRPFGWTLFQAREGE